MNKRDYNNANASTGNIKTIKCPNFILLRNF